MATAKIGDNILFKREGQSYKGSVTVVRENSVIVEYGYNNEKNQPLTTIVNHKNYKITKEA
ncbi:Uncharacterized protein conserved in bacteria (DUF2187) [Mycobacteroides abscessus subsp. abscessus]|nr:Uncharacterized protein conserved in bacteria (DUF2187) [Mycobacteroides abscessus subsp. abscessus]